MFYYNYLTPLNQDLLRGKSGMILGASMKSRGVQTIDRPPPAPPVAPRVHCADAGIQTDFVDEQSEPGPEPPPPSFSAQLQWVLGHRPREPLADTLPTIPIGCVIPPSSHCKG